MILNTSNSVIKIQKEALTHANEGEAWKAKIHQLEQQHVEEKIESLLQFEEYKKQLLLKE